VKQVRPNTAPLQVKHPADGAGVMLPSGQVKFPKLTDWIVSRSGQVIDVCDDAQLARSYTEIQDGLLIPRPLCTQIEEITGVGTTKTPEALCEAIGRLARIRVGDVKIPFTPGQLEEITHRADKRGQTVKQTIEAIVERIKDEIFYKS